MEMIGVGFRQQGVKFTTLCRIYLARHGKVTAGRALLCPAQPLCGTELWLLLRC